MLFPGPHRAVERTTIELCMRNGDNEPRVVEYTTYEAGDEFAIPTTVNGYFYRIMFDRDENKPMGRCERITKAEAP